MATVLSAQHEESQQHMMSLKDLVRDYEHRLQQAIEQRETEEQLSAAQLQELQAWRQKLQTLQCKKKQRDKEANKLAARAGLRERESLPTDSDHQPGGAEEQNAGSLEALRQSALQGSSASCAGRLSSQRQRGLVCA